MRPVVWSEAASQEIFGILRYVSSDDIDAAERIVDTIEEAGEKLGRYATGRPGRVSGTYEKSMPRLPYIIVYMIEQGQPGETIVILRVIHTSRDWPDETWPAEG